MLFWSAIELATSSNLADTASRKEQSWGSVYNVPSKRIILLYAPRILSRLNYFGMVFTHAHGHVISNTAQLYKYFTFLHYWTIAKLMLISANSTHLVGFVNWTWWYPCFSAIWGTNKTRIFLSSIGITYEQLYLSKLQWYTFLSKTTCVDSKSGLCWEVVLCCKYISMIAGCS